MIPEGWRNLKVSLDGICTSQVLPFHAGPDEIISVYFYHQKGIALINMLFDNNNYFILERR